MIKFIILIIISYRNGSAIYLDEELLNGHSYCCDTYGSPQLNGKTETNETEFKCLGMEIYIIE